MRIRFVLWGAVVLLLGVPAALCAATPTDHENPAEIARIQQHLAVVESELLARDVSQLTAPQRANRATHVRRLREYRERGRFPHNHDFPGRREPYFVDAHGTLCAMAYLIAEAGRGDMVERIAGARNNARVPELADDAELVAWLDSAGISVHEAARIQPAYSEPGVSNTYAQISAVATGVQGAVIAWNLLAEPQSESGWWAGSVGILTGGSGIFLGVSSLLTGNTNDPSLFWVNVGAGAASAVLGVRTHYRHRRDRADRATAAMPAAAGAAPPSVTMSAAPLWAAGGGAGVQVSVQF